MVILRSELSLETYYRSPWGADRRPREQPGKVDHVQPSEDVGHVGLQPQRDAALLPQRRAGRQIRRYKRLDAMPFDVDAVEKIRAVCVAQIVHVAFDLRRQAAAVRQAGSQPA